MAKQRRKPTTKKQTRGSKKSLYTVGAIVLVGLVVGVFYLLNSSDQERVIVEELSGPVGPGQGAFQKRCAECHGTNAVGTGKGPPLVHRYYNPSHHADFSFVRAVRFGVRQHHWRFGNMPPQPEVTGEELDTIIGYVRELQRANGIY